jgi:hypothetical protein
MSKQGNAGKMLVGFVVRHKPSRQWLVNAAVTTPGDRGKLFSPDWKDCVLFDCHDDAEQWINANVGLASRPYHDVVPFVNTPLPRPLPNKRQTAAALKRVAKCEQWIGHACDALNPARLPKQDNSRYELPADYDAALRSVECCLNHLRAAKEALERSKQDCYD